MYILYRKNIMEIIHRSGKHVFGPPKHPTGGLKEKWQKKRVNIFPCFLRHGFYIFSPICQFLPRQNGDESFVIFFGNLQILVISRAVRSKIPPFHRVSDNSGLESYFFKFDFFSSNPEMVWWRVLTKSRRQNFRWPSQKMRSGWFFNVRLNGPFYLQYSIFSNF